MRQDPGVLVAVDVGTTKVCTIIARREDAGGFRILSFSALPSGGIAAGVVTDTSEAVESIRNSIQDAARQASVTVESAYIGISGSHVSFENRLDRINGAASRGVITRDDLDRVPEAVAKVSARPGRKVIHALPRSYSLDGQGGIRDPLGMHTSKLDVESHLVLADDDSVRSLRGAIERSGIRVQGMVLDPIASAEAVLTEREKLNGVVLVDIGGGTSDVIVFERGSVQLTASLPVGGFQFTNDICVTYGTNYTSAETVKIEKGNVDPTGFKAADEVVLPVHGESRERQRHVALRELSQLLRERVFELSRMIRLKMIDAGIEDPGSANLVLTGGSSRLVGMEDLFKQRLTPNVRVAGPDPALDLPEGLREPEFSTSVGLLRWALKQPSDAAGSEQLNGAGTHQPEERPSLFRRLLQR